MAVCIARRPIKPMGMAKSRSAKTGVSASPEDFAITEFLEP